MGARLLVCVVTLGACFLFQSEDKKMVFLLAHRKLLAKLAATSYVGFFRGPSIRSNIRCTFLSFSISSIE